MSLCEISLVNCLEFLNEISRQAIPYIKSHNFREHFKAVVWRVDYNSAISTTSSVRFTISAEPCAHLGAQNAPPPRNGTKAFMTQASHCQLTSTISSVPRWGEQGGKVVSSWFALNAFHRLNGLCMLAEATYTTDQKSMESHLQVFPHLISILQQSKKKKMESAQVALEVISTFSRVLQYLNWVLQYSDDAIPSFWRVVYTD